MAGTINFAMTQQFDMDGRPLSGGLLYFFAAGTSTPQSAYQDLNLTIAHPNPIVLDASGRVPMFYLADGFIKIRLTDENGVTIIAADQLLVIGPSTGSGGGGGGAPANSVLETGDIKVRYGTGPLTGFVRCNGNSISKLGAGGSESASDGNQALFEYLWQFSNITLNTAKGSSATVDWSAGRQLFLPDMRGRMIAGLDDMGATAAARLTPAFFGFATTIGNTGGGESGALTSATMLPSHSHAVTGETGFENRSHYHELSPAFVTGSGATDTQGSHAHTVASGITSTGAATGLAMNASNQTSDLTTGSNGSHAHNVSVTVSGASDFVKDNGTTTGPHYHTVGTLATSPIGSSVAFRTVAPAMVFTVYIKL